MALKFSKVVPTGAKPAGFDADTARGKVIELIDANIILLEDPNYVPAGKQRKPIGLVKTQAGKAYVIAKYGRMTVDLDGKGSVSVECPSLRKDDIKATLEELRDYIASGKADKGLEKAYDEIVKMVQSGRK